MSKYKLLALDLDGTLLDKNSNLPEENIKAVRLAQENGVQIVLCTGRNPVEAKNFSDNLLKPADWLVTSNGAYIFKPDGSHNIFSSYLSYDDCKLLLDICREYNTDPCFYDENTLYYGNAFKMFFKEMNIRRDRNPDMKRDNSIFLENDSDWDNLLKNHELPFIKSILYHNNPQIVDEIIKKLEQTKKFELAPSVLFGGLMKNVEINCIGVHKGRGLQILCEHLNISMQDVIAIGDSDNDLTMLKMSGLGIAMGNADEHIKKVADTCTLTNIEFGVSKAISQYILND